MNDVNFRIARLSPAKRALLEQRLKQKVVDANGQGGISIEKRAKPNSTPLSFAQARMWLLDRLEPGNSAYNRPSNIQLTGILNVAALEQSLNEVVRRHDVLRTSFQESDGELFQEIVPAYTITLPTVDLCYLSSQERKYEAQRLAKKEAQRPFDLSRLPLVRATLLRLDEKEHILLLTLHHIIFDGWSMGVLLQELATVYKAFCSGKPSPLPELPIQYADFALWQRERLQGDLLESQLEYWKKQLVGNLPVLELPSDRPRAAVQTNKGARQELLLPQNLSQSLKDLSRTEGVTLFMTLLAAFEILLHRYTGQEDIIVGAPIAGRDRIEIENLIGVFINTLVLRTQLNEDYTFKELLARVRQIVTGAITHQEIPLEKLIEEIQPERDLSHTPLFQVLFQLRNVSQEAAEVQGLKFQEFQFDRGIVALDLTLDIIEEPKGLSCIFAYKTDLFDAATISRMAGNFQTLLEGIVANPAQSIFTLPILNSAEKYQLLREWNQTNKNYPQHQCIHQLFEAQVERTPDAVAIVFKEEQLTYRELNARANQLARYLQTLDVEPEFLVGLLVERSPEMIVGLLGILKAGGAYMPLDLAYPKERLAFMLSDSQVSVLLTQKKLEAELPEPKVHVVYLDADWEKVSQKSKENLVSGVVAENLAYVIYTSGSTGKPKGVMVTHRNLVNAYLAWEDVYQLRSSCTSHLQMASFSFDVFSGDLVRALCSGAKLILCPREWLLVPEKLCGLMQKEKVDCAEFVPAVLRNLIQYLERTEQKLSFMRLLIVGSDSWYMKEYQQFRHFLGADTRLINSYGVSEATIDSSYFESAAVSLSADRLVPIGRQFPNKQLYILDYYLQPVPIGVPGELYIGGDGLARGYLNRHKLTQEKFISNPFDRSRLLYKTGDLVRYLPDGNIEFLGRIDNQVKIRGFRIELGEIESFLSTHNQIQQAVVIAREDVPGDKRLVAYLVTSSESLTSSQLRQFLKQKLPEYMVPSAFVLLENLPLTPNGKIDRRALPAPDISQLKGTKTFVEPGTPTEQQLAEIWGEVLGVKRVGIQDNFFELGGHSLLATQALSRIRQNLKVELPLRTLFEASTIKELGSHIENILWTKTVPNSSNDEIDNYYEEGEL